MKSTPLIPALGLASATGLALTFVLAQDDSGHDHEAEEEHAHTGEHAHGDTGPNGGHLEHLDDDLVEIALNDERLLELRLFTEELEHLELTEDWSARGHAGQRGEGALRLAFEAADDALVSDQALPEADDLPLRLVISHGDEDHRFMVHLHGDEVVSGHHDHEGHDHGDHEGHDHGDHGDAH